MARQYYTVVAYDWINLEATINDLSSRVTSQELFPTASPTFAGISLTTLSVSGTVTFDTALTVPSGGTGASTFTDGGVLLGSGTGALTAMAVLADGEFIVGDGTTDPVAESGNTARTSLGLGTGDSPQFTGLTLTGKLDAGSQASPIDVTNTRQYGAEIHYSGNNYSVTGFHSRAQLVTTDTTATAQGAVLQAANNDDVDAGVLQGALIEAIGKSTANASTISTMRGALVGTEWGAFDTVTNLKTLHVRGHSRNAAGNGSFGTGYGLYIENEAVGGNGQAYDAGIYFKGTNLSGGNSAYAYGIDFSGGTYSSEEIKLANGSVIGSDKVTLQPTTDSTTFVQALAAAGGTPVLNIDTTNKDVELSNTLTLQDTADSSTLGVIYKGADPFIHNYHNTVGGGAIPIGENIFLGTNTGNFTMGGTATNTSHASSNVGIGSLALNLNTTGYGNFGLGSRSLRNNTTGYYNVAIGVNALFTNTTGYSNVAIGGNALYFNVGTGLQNVCVGRNSGYRNTTGDGNTCIGFEAGELQTSASWNTFVGHSAGAGSAIGAYHDNVAIGSNAGFDLTTGGINVFIGRACGANVTSGHSNIFIGPRAGLKQTTASNLFIVDNQDRSSTAGELESAILYGVMGANGAQTLRSNIIDFTLANTTHEDSDGGREVKLRFKGQQSGGEETTLGYEKWSHDGASDDQKGQKRTYVNSGTDDDAPTLRQTLSADGTLSQEGNVYPMTDDTYYLGKNDDDTPFAWKGIILKDQAGTGKYYRLEVSGDALQITDLTD